MLSHRLRSFLAANNSTDEFILAKPDMKIIASTKDTTTLEHLCRLTAHLETGKNVPTWLYANLLRIGFTPADDTSWEAPPNGSATDMDWVTEYIESNYSLSAIEPYKAYSSVLCSNPTTLLAILDKSIDDPANSDPTAPKMLIIEPMAGTSELSWYGHFFLPHFDFYMIDLDATAKEKVMQRPWLREPTYVIGDVSDVANWPTDTTLPRLTFLGKQSQNFLTVKQVIDFMTCALNVNVPSTLLLEVCQASTSDEVMDFDCMTPNTLPNGLQIGMKLISESSLPYHKALMALVAKDKTGATRTLFEYDWTLYNAPHLALFATMLPEACQGSIMWKDWDKDEWVSEADGVNNLKEHAYDEGEIMWLRFENKLARDARLAAEAVDG